MSNCAVYPFLFDQLKIGYQDDAVTLLMRTSEPACDKVWRALCDIPYGETRTYGEVAAAVGNPKACRAVGMANRHNPILIAVPCHRVIGRSGKLVGYASGLDMKKALLQLEKGAMR